MRFSTVCVLEGVSLVLCLSPCPFDVCVPGGEMT